MLLMIAQIAILASGFGISIILARGLGPGNFGIYGAVLAVLTTFERVLSAGVRAAAGMIASGGDGVRQAEIEQSTRVLMFLWGVALSVVLWLSAPIVGAHFGAEPQLVRILTLSLPATAIYVAYDAILSGRREFGRQGLLQTVQSFVKLLGVLVLLFIGLSVSGAFVAHVIGALAVAAVVLLVDPPGARPPMRRVAGPMVRVAFTTGFYTIALAMLMNLGIWQLKSLRPEDAVVAGMFVASQNVTRMLLVVPQALSGVLFTSASWAVGASSEALFRKYVGDVFRFSLILMVPACVLIAVAAEDIVMLLFGTRYAGGGAVLRALCVGYAAMGLFDILAHALMADGRYRAASVIACMMLPALFGLNFLAIPAMLAVGAAWSMVAIFAGGSMAIGVALHRRTGGFVRWGSVARILLASAAAGALAWLVPSPGYWLCVKLACAGAFFLGVLWVSREISADDVSVLLKRGKT